MVMPYKLIPWEEWLFLCDPAPLWTMTLIELVADVAHQVVGCTVQLLFHLALHLIVERLQGGR